MSCQKREVAQATPDRIGVLAPVFGRAFVDEPMTEWSLGDRGDMADRLTRCFAYFLEQVLGLGLVWEVGGGSGAAVWVPPKRFDDWDVHPWSQPRITASTDDDGRRYTRFWDWVDSQHPAEPLWQLDSIAVEPTAQGQGLGAALIATGLALAQADGIGAFLSTGTARNVKIYARSGFRVVEEADAPDGGPRIYFMRWDP
jgi:ribosomal protein S18 acetylase RimI-like enzyme